MFSLAGLDSVLIDCALLGRGDSGGGSGRRRKNYDSFGRTIDRSGGYRYSRWSWVRCSVLPVIPAKGKALRK